MGWSGRARRREGQCATFLLLAAGCWVDARPLHCTSLSFLPLCLHPAHFLSLFLRTSRDGQDRMRAPCESQLPALRLLARPYQTT